jgi:type II secretory pathway pseudopilin PulG
VIDIPRKRRAAAGFSLVEMAIVTLLVGILLTMGLAALKATRDASAASQTRTKQNTIKDALIAYIRRNNRLPCADIDFGAPDGVENRATAGDPTTACATAPSNARFGILPYVTLGLARDAAVDGWGNFFSYQVSNTVTSTTFNPGTGFYVTPITNPNLDWTLSANLRSGSSGELTVNTRDAAGAVVAAASNAVAVVVSHGPNGLGAYTVSGTRNSLPAGADELDNTNGDTTYFWRVLTTNDAATGGAFDDYVMVLGADDLLAPLFKDGTLKSPAGQVADMFIKIENAITAYAVANGGSYGNSSCTSSGSNPRCRVIPYVDAYNGTTGVMVGGFYNGGVPWATIGLTRNDTWDPWGRPLRYTILANTLANGGSSGSGIGSNQPAGYTGAYSLTSFGPDRTQNTADDISTTVTVNDVRAGLTGTMP